jgi:hypothetical protein
MTLVLTTGMVARLPVLARAGGIRQLPRIRVVHHYFNLIILIN